MPIASHWSVTRSSEPLTAASKAALDIAGAGHNLDTTATWLAVVLALAVAAPPILAVVMPWLVLRSGSSDANGP